MINYCWQDKVWGKTKLLVESDRFQRHELIINKGGYCSVHYHRLRANRFIMKSGVVRIVEFIAWTTRQTMLTPDMVYEVPSLVPHMFQVLEDGEMFEEYWNDRDNKPVDGADIVRLCEGGAQNHEETWDQTMARVYREQAGCNAQ